MAKTFHHPTRRIGRALSRAAVLAALVLIPARADAGIPSAIVSSPHRLMNDFTLVARSGQYHLFHTLGVRGNRFGHLVSTDLHHWTQRPDVLVGTQASDPTRPDGRNGWNRDHVWAPSIVLHQGVYHLFYTGVRDRPGACEGQRYQAIGVATSSDLENWRLEPDPWMSPAKVSWAMQDTCAYDFGNFRDPSVVQDTATGDWLMFYTTVPDADAVAQGVQCAGACGVSCGYDPKRFVIGMARAPAGYTRASDWVDDQPLWRTYQTCQGSGCFKTWESPHAFRRTWQGRDLWYLMASVGTGLYAVELVCLTSPVPSADPAEWTLVGSLETMGVRDPYGNTLGPYESYGWFGSEYMKDPNDGREYLANCIGNTIQIRQILWRADDPGFDLVEPFRVVSIEPDRAIASAGTTVNLVFEGRNAVDPLGARQVAIEAVRLDDHGAVVEVVRAGDLGLPPVVTLTGDRTVVPWVAREWPAGAIARLRVRLKDTSTGVASTPIVVAPRVTAGGGGPRRSPTGDVPGAAGAASPLELRALDGAVAREWARLAYGLPEDLAIRLDVFDTGGRRVRSLVDGARPGGPGEAHWDLRDAGGRPVPSGVYFARLDTPLGRRTARLVVLPSR